MSSRLRLALVLFMCLLASAQPRRSAGRALDHEVVGAPVAPATAQRCVLGVCLSNKIRKRDVQVAMSSEDLDPFLGAMARGPDDFVGRSSRDSRHLHAHVAQAYLRREDSLSWWVLLAPERRESRSEPCS